MQLPNPLHHRSLTDRTKWLPHPSMKVYHFSNSSLIKGSLERSHFLLVFLHYRIHSYTHAFMTLLSSALVSSSLSAQVEDLHWGVQCLDSNSRPPDALPTEPRLTLTKPRRTLYEPHRTLTEPRRTLTEPRRTLTEPRCTLTEPRRTLNEPCRNLTEPRRTLTEPHRTLNATVGAT